MKDYVIISKDGGHYSAEQATKARPLTASELRDMLQDVEDDTPILIYEGGYGVTHFAATSVNIESLDEEEEEQA